MLGCNIDSISELKKPFFQKSNYNTMFKCKYSIRTDVVLVHIIKISNEKEHQEFAEIVI